MYQITKRVINLCDQFNQRIFFLLFINLMVGELLYLSLLKVLSLHRETFKLKKHRRTRCQRGELTIRKMSIKTISNIQNLYVSI